MDGEWACDKGGVQKEGHQNITLEVVPGELEVTIPENPFEDMENKTDLELNYELRYIIYDGIDLDFLNCVPFITSKMREFFFDL